MRNSVFNRGAGVKVSGPRVKLPMKEKKNNITKEAHQTGYEVEKMPRDQMRPKRPYGRVLARTARAADNSFRTKKKAKPEKQN